MQDESRRAGGLLNGVVLAPGDRVRTAARSPFGHYRATREASP